jgi:hypothetical protein
LFAFFTAGGGPQLEPSRSFCQRAFRPTSYVAAPPHVSDALPKQGLVHPAESAQLSNVSKHVQRSPWLTPK